MERTPNINAESKSANICSTTIMTSNYPMTTVASSQSQSGTPLSSLSVTGTNTTPANYKTKDGLIRMLLQTATPSGPLQQQRYHVNQEKQAAEGIQGTSEIKIHGGILGHYNNGHVTQPHPSAIQPLPKGSVQLNSHAGTNLLGQLISQSVSANQSEARAIINSMPAAGSLQGNASHIVPSHSVKIDMKSQALNRASGSTVMPMSEKVLSLIAPSTVTPSFTSETSGFSDGKVAVHDEAPFHLIHQISKLVINISKYIIVFGSVKYMLLYIFHSNSPNYVIKLI